MILLSNDINKENDDDNSSSNESGKEDELNNMHMVKKAKGKK
jgi:hypothetical protein